MEYSNKNTMTRKEYLKSKGKNKFDFSKLKYVLLIIVVILLSIYLYKQLNIYNNVTKIANKVVEETALKKTMTMYYISKSYTKNVNTELMLYKSSDESRTKIKDGQNISSIKLEEDKLYGIKNKALYEFDLVNGTNQCLVKDNVKYYDVYNDKLYIYNEKEKAIYVSDINKKNFKKIISIEIYDIQVVDNQLYLIAKGKTNRSIIRYSLDGKNKTILSDKYIVQNMYYNNQSILFTTKDMKVYMIDKNNIKKLNVSVDYLKNNQLTLYKDKIYYINKSDNNMLYCYDLKTGVNKMLVKKDINSLNNDQNIIYLDLNGSIEFFKYDINENKLAKVTSVRQSEYICKN